MLSRVATALFVTVTLLVVFAGVKAAAPKPTTEPVLVYTSTQHYDSLAWLHGGERFPAGAKLMLRSGGSSREVSVGFYAAADANVSFDGTKILFAGKKSAGDAWQIWETAVTGGDPKQLTSCEGDCVRPLYLPEERIVYAHKTDGHFQLEATQAEGAGVVRLTSTPGNAIATDVLRDGRILFEASYPLGEGSSAELYTVYSDGSGVESYRCDHGNSRHSGKQASSGDIVFVNDGGIGRFTSALAHEMQIKVPAGQFAGDVIELDENRKLAAWREDVTGFYSLQEWNTTTNTLQPIVTQGATDLVQPQVVASRTIPNRHPSALHDWDGANVLCLNAYTSKMKIAKGSVESIQLYTLRDGKPVLLGGAHVEADGSFFLHVPADQPLQVQLLDKSGSTLQRERGWFWMRRGEQRECVGCHAGPERAPENAVPQVLVKSTEPADMTRQATNSRGGR